MTLENCKGCMAICGTANKPKEPEKCAGYIPKTNGNVFRGSSDEELAKFFAPGDRGCPPHRNFPCDCERGCGNCWLAWLKSPVEVDNGA